MSVCLHPSFPACTFSSISICSLPHYASSLHVMYSYADSSPSYLPSLLPSFLTYFFLPSSLYSFDHVIPLSLPSSLPLLSFLALSMLFPSPLLPQPHPSTPTHPSTHPHTANLSLQSLQLWTKNSSTMFLSPMDDRVVLFFNYLGTFLGFKPPFLLDPQTFQPSWRIMRMVRFI